MALSLESVLERHERRQKVIGKNAATQVLKLWKQTDPKNIAGSWRGLLPAAMNVVAAAQVAAAARGGVYVEDALYAQGGTFDADGLVNPARLAGVASDGRDLARLLYQPAISTLTAIGKGAQLDQAQALGLLRLDVITRTQIADAGRGAESVAIAARPKVAGYVRMLSAPSCSRCIILAGRHYRWNAGFQRHPRCDCRHVPVAEDAPGARETNPKKAFESLSAAEQDRIFTKAGAEAIRNGADIGQVVNARKGMATATVFGRSVSTTSVNAGRRVRLMPESILAEAKGNRAMAIRLLRLHGYIR